MNFLLVRPVENPRLGQLGDHFEFVTLTACRFSPGGIVAGGVEDSVAFRPRPRFEFWEAARARYAVSWFVNRSDERVQLQIVGELCGQRIGVLLVGNEGADTIELSPVNIHRRDFSAVLLGNLSG